MECTVSSSLDWSASNFLLCFDLVLSSSESTIGIEPLLLDILTFHLLDKGLVCKD